MSDTSDDDKKSDGSGDRWASSGSENSAGNSSKEGSLSKLTDGMDSDSGSDVKLNFATDSEEEEVDRRKGSSSGSDVKQNFASSNDSVSSASDAESNKSSARKLQLKDELNLEDGEIPDLTDDESEDSSEENDGKKSVDELPDDPDDEFIMKQLEKLIVRRNKKDNNARLRWLAFLREQKEAEEEATQFQAYWDRRHQEDKDLWRDKDFANAIYKVSRAGYKGEHGHFDVPEETIQQLNALYMQVTVGDYDGNKRLKWAKEWKKLKGKTKIDCQREFIKLTNLTITKYGWNPPEGWIRFHPS